MASSFRNQYLGALAAGQQVTASHVLLLQHRSAQYTYLANSPLVSTVTFKQNSTTRMTTTRQYDNLNRLSSIKSAVNGLAYPNEQFQHYYVYNAANQRTHVHLANRSYWEYAYDHLGQVTNGVHRWLGNALVAGQQYQYAYDDIGNRSSTKAGGSETGTGLRPAAYTRNFLNQYDSRDVPNAIDVLGAAAVNATVTVEGQTAYRRGAYFWKETPLDNSSNARWEEINTVATVGASQYQDNRYAFLPKNQEQFTYDADGNLTQDGRWDYTWDAENRLVQVESRSDAPSLSRRKVVWEYDGKGRRVRQRVFVWNPSTLNYELSTDTKYLYDGWQCVAELNYADNALKRSYVWGTDLSGGTTGAGGVGGLLMLNSAANGTHFYTYDGNGNVVALVKATDGTASANYEYGPFGEAIRATGPLASENRFQFSTKRCDLTTDFLLYEYRVLRTDIGRWLSRDPLTEQEGGDLYGFNNNNPVTQIDLDGRQTYPFDPGNPRPEPRSDCELFEEWYKKEKKDMSWMNGLPSCPCTLVFRCVFIWLRPMNPDPTGWEDPSSVDKHPGAEWGLRSKTISSGARNQCGYDRNGKLITHGSGAGTVDRAALPGHYFEDYVPYLWAVRCGGNSIAKYLEVRPIENGNNCPKNP